MAKFPIEQRLKGFICTTAHPLGCAKNVEEQVAHARRCPFTGPKNVLIIGASTGYGLASRIAAAFGARASTLGVFYERPAEGDRTASAGWYNTAAFESLARKEGLVAHSINGDAFSEEIKNRTIDLIRGHFDPIDLVIYSLASPRRTDPHGVTHRSVLKPIGKPFLGKTVNTDKGTVHDIALEPATEEEIRETVAVMGGEDWQLWMDALAAAGVLAKGVKAVAYSYVGPQLTWPIYRDGTIGRAKADLEEAAKRIGAALSPLGGSAHISYNKAVVTQASAAIPVVPLYISLLFKIMKENGSHEGCIQQMVRLFKDRLYAGGKVDLLLRIDEREMDPAVQSEIARRWLSLSTENLAETTDFAGYRSDFLRLFGFAIPGVDYASAVEADVPLKGMQ
jgi:enoyl-[acyl-carrier protein] reductase/trans-2-enoyl-CoA reductase (NAD+)